MNSRTSPHSEALRDGAAAVGQGPCLLLSTVRLGRLKRLLSVPWNLRAVHPA